jgi:TP901 family phage tail tape measure protein
MIKLYDLVGTVDLNTKKFRDAMRQIAQDFTNNEQVLTRTEKKYNDLEKTIVDSGKKIAEAEKNRDEASKDVTDNTVKRYTEINTRLRDLEANRVKELQKNKDKEAQIIEDAAEKQFYAQKELNRKLAELNSKTSSQKSIRRNFLEERTHPVFYQQQFDNRNKNLQSELSGILLGVGGDASQLSDKQLTRLRLISGLLNQTFDKFIEKKIQSAQKELATLDVDNDDKLLRQIQKLKNQFRDMEDRLTNSVEKRTRAIKNNSDEINTEYSEKTAKLIEEQKQLGATLQKFIDRINSRFQKIIDSANNQILKAENQKVQNFSEDVRDRRSKYMQQIAGVGFAVYGATQFARAGAQDQQDVIGELNNTTLAFEKRAEKTTEINAASLRTGRSVKELAVAFREIENVLGSGTKGMDTWRQSTKAAIATNSQIGSVARSTAAIMKLYPKEFGNATEAINVLSLAARKSPLEFEDFSNVMGNVVGFAKQVGLSATETTAALSLFSEEQLRSAEAGTQLRNVVAKISTPTKEVAKVLADITKRSGVDLVGAFSTAGVESLGFAGVLAKVDEAAKKLNISSSDLARSLFPNLRGTVGGTILVEKLDEYLKIVEELNGARKDSTFIEQSYALAMNTTNTQLNRAEQASRQLSQELAVAMLPAVNSINIALGGLNKILNFIPQEAKTAGVTFAGVGAGLAVLAQGGKLALTFLSNLHPAAKIASVVVGLLAAAYSAYAVNQKEAIKPEKDLKDALEGVNRETYKRLDGISSYEKSIDRLFGKQELSLGQEAEKIRMTEDIFKATGIEIKSTDDLATAHKKLAEAIQVANDKKREQQQLFVRQAIRDTVPAVNTALQKVKDQEGVTVDLRSKVLLARQGYLKEGTIAELESRLESEVKKLKSLKSEYEIIYRKQQNEISRLMAESRSGDIPGLTSDVNPTNPFKPGKTDGQKTEEQRLSKELSQRKSDVDNLYREWLNVEEKLFKIKNGDSAESQVAFQKYISGTQFYKDARAVDSMEDNQAFSFIQNLSNRLLVAWTASAPKLDVALKAQEESKKKLEFALKQENALIDLKNDLRNKIKDLSFVDGEKLTEVEKVQRKLAEVDPLFGVSLGTALTRGKGKSAEEGTELIRKLTSAAIEADQRKNFKDYLEKEAKSSEELAKKLVEFTQDRVKTVADIKAKAEDILNPPDDRDVILRELSVFRWMKEIKDPEIRELLDGLIDKVIAFRKASEKKEKTIFDDLPEKLTKIRGEIASITGGDFMAFANTLGITSDDLKNNDKFGFGKAMLEELYTLEKAKKSIEEIYKKLKTIRKRETGQTGIPEIDAVNEELRKRDQRLGYINDLENNFKRGVAAGVRGGLKQGLQEMRRSIEDALINNASNAIGKLIFDGIRSTGVFDQIFGSTKLGENAQSALNSPEVFAEILAQKVLNVRVVDSFGNVPGFTPQGVPGTSSGIRMSDIPLSDGSAGAGATSRKFGILDAASAYSKYQYGGTAGKVSALGDVAKFAGLKGIAKFAGAATPYLIANDLLGDPLGRAGRWLGGSLFGSGKRRNSGRGQSITVNMPNASITSPTDAAYVASDVARNLRNSPQLARG